MEKKGKKQLPVRTAPFCYYVLSVLPVSLCFEMSFMLSDMCILSSSNDDTFFPNRWAFFDFQCKKKVPK